MPFFDFHLHPTLKCMFSQDKPKTSPWSDIDPMVVPWFLRWCTDFQYILSSQADLRQLNILIDLKHMSLGARRFFIERVRPAPDFTGINQPLVCTHAGFTGISYGDIPDYCQPQNSDSSRGSISILWGKPKRYEYGNTFTAFNPSSINLYNEDRESDGGTVSPCHRH